MRRFLSLLLILLVGASAALAQQRKVSGQVTSMDGKETLPGVNVFVKEFPNTGTTTNIDGKYELKSLPAGSKTLVFRFVGMKLVEYPISSEVVNAKMEADNQQIEEVVVVAYGTVKKSNMTTSAAIVGSKELQTRPVSDAIKALEGQAVGVQVTPGLGAPGSAPTIRIRGVGSVNASSDPLYVVDGIPYDGGISNINTADIESMTVLKDAAATALYGSRAANGVVIVTTKKGKTDQFSVNAKVNYGVSTRGISEYSRVGATEYYPLVWQGLRNSYSYGDAAFTNSAAWQAGILGAGVLDAANIKASNNLIPTALLYNIISTDGKIKVADNLVVGTDGKLVAGGKILSSYNDLDWYDELSRLGKRGDYNISASGGSKKSDYYFSIGYLKENGYVKQSDYERMTARANVSVTPTTWLKIGTNLSGTVTNSNLLNATSSDATSYANPFFFARNIGPIYPVYLHKADGSYDLDAFGSKQYDYGQNGARGSGASAGRNVLAEMMWNSQKNKISVLDAKTFADITLPYDFKLTVNGGYWVSNGLKSKYENTKVGDGAPAGRFQKTNSINTSITLNQLLTWKHDFGKHNVDVLAGHEIYAYEYNNLYGMKQGQVLEGIAEFPNFTNISSLDSKTDKDRIESYISRINYTYDDKYFATASYRRDGSSRFSEDVRWGNFFSGSLGWNLYKEDFINSIDWINSLKLRASYGETGNNALFDPDGYTTFYPYQSLYDLGYNNGLSNATGMLAKTTMGNKNLTWETNKQTNIGVDFGFLNRFNGSVEWFNRQSDNLLFYVPMPLSAGVFYQPQNIGSMYNRGFEVSLTANILNSKDGFRWTSSINATTYKNEITKMPEAQKTIIKGTKQLKEGHSIYDYYLRQWAGVDPRDGAGLYVYNSELGDAAFDEAKTPYIYRTIDGKKYTTDPNKAKYDYSGSSLPDVFGGWTNTFSYKGINLSVLLTYSFGGKIYDGAYAALMSYSAGGAMHEDMKDAWQKPGDITDVPRIDAAKNSNFTASSTRWLVSSNYVAIKNISLGYTFPQSILSKIGVKGMNAYVSGDNLGLFCKRKGMNPQESMTGVTSNTYSMARIFTFGVNLTL